MPNFERRIYLYMAAIIVCLLPLGVFGFFAIEAVVSEQHSSVSKHVDELLIAARLRFIDSTLANIIPVYVLSGDDALLASFENRFDEFDALADQLRNEEPDPVTASILDRSEALFHQMHAVTRPGIELRKSGSSLSKLHDYFRTNLEPLTTELRTILRGLVTKETRELMDARNALSRTIARVLIGLVVFSVLAFVFLILIGFLTVRTMREKRIHDQTQEETLTRQKQMAQARKEVVEIVAHDLKSPLAAIKMGVELSLEEITRVPHGDGTILEGLTIAQRSSVSMARLIDDLLDHAKIEAGQLILGKSRSDVTTLLKELSERFRSIAKSKDVTFKSEIAPGGLGADCDLGRLEQAVSNLLSNALKFTPAGGIVELTAMRAQRQIVITVKDSGRGMSREQLPHIFERFWQGKETASLGTGLGLAITKAIVDAHGGSLKVESEVGRGSKFILALPAHEVPAQKVPASFYRSAAETTQAHDPEVSP